ncbi:MAG: MFS transporter [Clostridiales bacterium]|nr:MFS transporter [Clostridiales bacterium]
MKKALEKVALKTKIGFGIGDLGFNIGVQATALVLIKFYTDTLLIGAGIAGIVVLVSKIIDAITDPAMGIIADRTKSKWGKFRPYLLYGAIPFGLSFFLLLNAPMAWALNLRIVYAFVTYIFFSVMLTITNVPYQSLLPVLTSNSDERISLSSFRSIGGIIGVLFAAVAIVSMVDIFGAGDTATGYRITAAIFGAVIALTTLICFATTKEKYTAKKDVKITVKQSFKLLFGSKPFVVLTISVLIIMIAVNTLAATIFFYFEYYLMDAGLGTIGFGAAFVAAILSMPLMAKIAKKKSNRFAYIMGVVIMCIGLLGVFFAGTSNILMTVVFLVLFGIGLATNYLCPWAMLANTIEHSQLKTGIRKEGTFYGAFFFVIKLSAALAGFIVGQVLQLGEYVANLANQAESALTSIRMLTTLIPVGFMIVGMIVLFLFTITGKQHDQMVKDIEEMEM